METARDRAEKIISSWSTLYDARNRFLKSYRTVWDIPLKNNRTQVLFEEISPGANVFEIGSSDRHLEGVLTNAVPNVTYKSMDIDRETRHDYYDLDAVDETFDAVLLFEVIEHLPFAEGVRLLARAFELLHPGGKLIMTTPNIAHPTHYYRDPTHVQPWSHEGLGGALTALGFDSVRCYRIFDAPAFEKLMRVYVTAWLARYLGIDFAHSLLVVASRAT